MYQVEVWTGGKWVALPHVFSTSTKAHRWLSNRTLAGTPRVVRSNLGRGPEGKEYQCQSA